MTDLELQSINVLWGLEKEIPHLIIGIYTEYFGIDALHVREVIKYTKPVRVSNRVAFVEGLLNYHGDFVIILDFRKICNLEVPPYNRETVIVMLEVEGKKLGLIADKVIDFTGIPEGSITNNLNDLPPKKAGLLSGVSSVEERPLFIIDLKKVVNLYETIVANAANVT